MRTLKHKLNTIVEHAEPNLPMIGMLGSIGYPLFYMVWRYLIPQPYENLSLRLAEAVISLPWLFYPQLPKKAKDMFPYYFFVVVLILMPFFFHFMMLKNEWSVVWVMSSMACLFLLILIVNDWVFVCGYTFAGFVLAYAVVYATDGYVSYTYFRVEYIPVYLFVLVGGLIGNHKRQVAHQTKLLLMRSLSGSIAHEMRNPLSAITNAMGTLQSIIPEKPDNSDEQEKFELSNSSLFGIHDVIDASLSTIKRGNKIIDSVLVTLQDDLMDISNFKKVSVKSSIRAAIGNYGYNDPREKSLIIEKTEESFDFFGDKDLFIYVLFNLIKNALHYQDKPGFKIEISTETGSSVNYVRVRDTGPGIPHGRRKLIFERFYTFGKSGGNGLGLSFCRRVIESFGGAITCESEEGSWTEFIISLPGYTSKTATDLKREILKNKRVLIVDDQISNRLLLMKFISELGCANDQADNGKQALNLFSKNCYDLVFMDFEMPFLTGDRAVTMMREDLSINPKHPRKCVDVPVVGITALPLAEALPRAAVCGMNEVISKPMKRKDIGRVIERYFFSETPSISSDFEEMLSNARILLVDDNETSRKFMSMILAHYGCLIGQAENGKKAIELLDEQDFNLILMDMEMPVMNGVETTRAIRNGAAFSRFTNHRSIPIIALTGNTDPKSISEVKEAGMNHFLSKPIFRDELISTIAIWLKNEHDVTNIPEIHQENAMMSSESAWAAIRNENILDRSIISSLMEISDRELFGSLLEVFFKDAEILIGELERSASIGDIGLFSEFSHTLKGSSASIGANRLYVLSTHLNNLSRREEWPDHVDWLGILKQTFSKTVEEMGMSMNSDTNHVAD